MFGQEVVTITRSVLALAGYNTDQVVQYLKDIEDYQAATQSLIL